MKMNLNSEYTKYDTAEDLTLLAAQQGVSLFIDDGKLRFAVEKGYKIDEKLLDALKFNKALLTDYLLKSADNYGNAEILSVESQPRPEQIPTSPIQRRFWFTDKLHGGSSNHLPTAWKLTADINNHMLEAAIKIVIERHEILRTVYYEQDGEIYQQIIPSAPWTLHQQKLKTGDVETFINEQTAVSFDLNKDYPIRATLITTDKANRFLLFVFHHIAFDGWSANLFRNELWEAYQALEAQRIVQLPALKLQYADFAIWQHQSLKDTQSQKSIAYWEDKLTEVSVLELPTDFKRPLQQSHKGKVLHFSMQNALAEQVEQVARKKGTTVFTVLLTAIKVFLAKYAGQDDICVGSPLADRGQTELVPLIGPFLNMLVLRSELSGSKTFDEALAVVEQTVLEAFTHQAVPFETILDGVVESRDLSRTPVFQVTFTYHSHLQAEDNTSDSQQSFWEPISTEITSAQFDLSFHMARTAKGFTLAIHYCTDLFAEATIKKWQTHFERLLTEIGSKSDVSTTQLCMPDSEERALLLDVFNNTAAPYPAEQSVIGLFEQQVEKTPQAVALQFDGEKLTYGQLNEKSNRLAYYLHEQGIGKGARVGICMERSVGLMVSMLAILKTGAAFVPLDPGQPHSRLAFMLTDASVHWVLTEMVYDRQSISYTPLMPNLNEIQLVIPESLELSTYSVANLNYDIGPNDEVSIMYTSGSTGSPKGVRVHNRPVVRLVYNSSFDFLNNDTVFYQYAPIAFDASTIEIWGALLKGGTVAMAGAGQRSLETIAAEIKNMDVNTLWLTAGLFHSAVEELPQLFKGLRYVIAGGDSIAVESIRKLLKQHQGLVFINGYGPTEAVTFSAVRKITDIDTLAFDRNIIGKPIGNTKIYITDRYGNLVPEGAIGEILIGGDAVTLGYLNQEALNQKHFLQDQFLASGTGRIYCTGDMGRWLPDGNIEFLGRRDNQVKIRGFRIETAEIENVILQQTGISQCLVQCNVAENGIKQLVAYFVADIDCTEESIKASLKERLPEYMIPVVFIRLEQFPLTINGKINKKLLPAPTENTEVQNVFDYPDSAIEKQLAAIWSEVLGKEKISRHDNFFTIGGDSILSIKVISRIKKVLGCEVTVANFFQSPTVAELAQIIEDSPIESVNANRDNIEAQLAQLRSKILERMPDAEQVEDVFPMSDIQKGMVFASEMNPGKGIYHDQMLFPMPVADVEVFVKALSFLVAKHGILRTAYERNRYDEDVQVVYSDLFIPWQYYQLAGYSKSDSDAYIKAYMAKGLDQSLMEEKRLWRATGFQVQPSLLILLFEFHHSMLDGWSFASLVTEWYNIYTHLKQNPTYRPLPLKATYRDGIIESLLEKANEETITFWRNELEDYNRVNIFDNAEANEKFIAVFPEATLHKAAAVAKDRKIQVKSLFFTAYLYTINALGYTKDITVGIVTNVRPLQEDGEKVLGCFLNTIPFRYQLQNGNTWNDFLLDVDKKLIGLKGKDRLTLPEIAKITGEQSANGNPFFDILFNFVDFHVYNGIAIENDAIATEQLPELSSHEATNTLLDVSVSTTAGELSVYFLLRKKLLSGLTLQAVVSLYEQTLNRLLNFAHEPMRKQDILPESMCHRLINQLGKGAIKHINNISIPTLFKQYAHSQGESVAIIHNQRSLSYREVDEMSDKLAALLLSYNLPSDAPIAIYIPRSPEAIIAIMAVLKAGYAYLPLEVTLPQERIQYILNDAVASFVIVGQAQVGTLQEVMALPFFVIEKIEELSHLNKQALTLPTVAPDTAAYIIYTSGSTGLPKGVIVQHKCVINMVVDHADRFVVTPQDRILQFASLAFDASVLEIFTTLLSGATLLLADTILMDSTDTFCDYLKNNQCSLVVLTPAHLKVLDVEKLRFLRLVLTGGDVPDVQTAMQVLQFAQYFNCYGPTESTVSITSYQMKPDDANRKAIPIGRPNSNLNIYLIDELGQLVPESVAGEIVVSGEGVAKGYLNRPELTAEKFTTVFFQGKPERIYRTGDMGRWLPDGNLLFTGRIDDQVKVRGFRVEPAEIAHALNAIQTIKESFVLSLKNKDGAYRLLAFVVPAENYNQSDTLIHLAKSLPAYMLPTLYEIEAMPLTSNGKIDKRKLASFTIDTQAVYVEPSDEVEKWMATLWTSLIGKERIGVHDNFFELGGHSLLVAKMVTAIKERFHFDIGLKKVFELKSITNLAKEITQQTANVMDTAKAYTEIEL